MGDTIEAFVARIHSEGVEAGRQEAEKLLADARQQGEQIIADAKGEAETIVADAKTEGEGILSRARTELQLAARDNVLKLRDTLGAVIEQVLARGVGEKLDDPEFLGATLHELVTLAAKSDLEGRGVMVINVSPEMRDKLVDWALKELGQQTVDGLRHAFDLQGTLAQAGFEYNVTGATVEVTLDSVTEAMKELVGPRLREIIDQARRLLRGIDDSEDPLALGVMRAVGHAGNFLAHPHTRASFRKEQVLPSAVVDRDFRRQWEAKGHLTAAQRANARANELVEAYAAPGLAPEIAAELRQITLDAVRAGGLDALPAA